MLLALILGYVSFGHAVIFGAANPNGQVHYQMEPFLQGLAAGTRNQFYVENDGDVVTSGDITLTGRDLEVSSSNTSTSTVAVGCIELANGATSTASKAKLMFFASSTIKIGDSLVTAGFGGGTMQGFVLWGFGTCP